MTEKPDELEVKIFTSLSDGAPGSGSQDEPEPEKPQLTNAQILAGALGAGRDVFCIVTDFKSPKVTLSDDNCTTLGDAWGKVCDKHGLNLGGYLGDYGPEIAAALASFAIVKAVADGVKAEIAAREPVDVKTSEPQQPAAAPVSEFNG